MRTPQFGGNRRRRSSQTALPPVDPALRPSKWPRAEKPKSRNDRRTYHWAAPRAARALPPGLDNGPGTARSILSRQ